MNVDPTDNASHWALLSDINSNDVRIANNTYWYAVIGASSAVRAVDLHFSRFNMVSPGDTVSFPTAGTPPSLSFSGNLGSFSTGPMETEASGWQRHVQISTDPTSPSEGFKIDSADITCLPEAPTNALPAWTAKKNPGFLTMTDDTVYYSYDPEPTNPWTGQPYHVHLSLTTQIAYGVADFDLYARCGALPTPTSYDFIGYSGDTREFIDITTTCGSAWYFAVNSYRGAGAYELKVADGGDEEACIAFDDGGGVFTLTEKQTYRDKIVAGYRGFYGATNGAILYTRLTFMNGNTGSTCLDALGQQRAADAVVRKDCSVSTTTTTGTHGLGPTTYCTVDLDNLPGPTVAHENSHHYWRLPDEYNTSMDTNKGCGHSLMDENQILGSNNVILQVYSYCTALNHRADPHLFTYTDPGLLNGSIETVGDPISMWVKLGGDGMVGVWNYFHRPINVDGVNPIQHRMRTVNTPDNYGFQDFNFNTYSPHVLVITNF